MKTEEELLRQEQMDANIYGSLRGMFEVLLLTTVRKAKEGEETKDDVEMLLQTYHSASEGSQRLAGLLRRARNT